MVSSGTAHAVDIAADSIGRTQKTLEQKCREPLGDRASDIEREVHMHRYSAVLSGAAPGLECASCLQVDDIGERVSLDRLLEESERFFDEVGESPKNAAYHFVNETKHCRSSFGSFLRNCRGIGLEIGTTLQSVTITSLGYEGTRLSDTWTPQSAISIALHGKVIEAFFQSPREFSEEQNLLAALPYNLFGDAFSAAYLFPYPFVFSPLAYASGVSYSPNVRRFGNVTDRDSERVANWANHCYRGRRASEGYLRDVYPVNIIGLEHMKRPVNGSDLVDWIRKDPARGNLAPLHEKALWAVASENIPSIRRELDKSKVLLSGFPPEPVGSPPRGVAD